MQKVCVGSPLLQWPREHFPHWPSSGRIQKSGIENMVLLPQFLYTSLLFCPSSQFPKVPKLPGGIWIWEWYSGSCSAQGRICLKRLRDSESYNCGKVLRPCFCLCSVSLIIAMLPVLAVDKISLWLHRKPVGLEVQVWHSLILFLRLLFHSFLGCQESGFYI